MDSSGRVHIAGARQGQTEILLDGFEINDPANGSFTPRVNVDAVQTVTVETGGYGAQYSHAGAGILALDTSVGDDKWRFGTTNFFPGVSIRDGVRFGNWFPRATFSGPHQERARLVFRGDQRSAQAHVVNGLPEGQNVATEWAGDNLLRAQVTSRPETFSRAPFCSTVRAIRKPASDLSLRFRRPPTCKPGAISRP